MSTGVATGFPPACRRLTAPAAVAVQCSVGRRACVAGSLARHRSTAAPTGARAVTSQGTAHRRPQIGAFGWPTRRHRAATNSGDRDHEAHLPTEHPPAQTQAWLHAPHAHAGRSNHHQAAAGKGPQAVDGLNNPEGGAELGSARPVARGPVVGRADAVGAHLADRGLRQGGGPPIVGGPARRVPPPPMLPSRLHRSNDIRAVLTGRNVVHGADVVVHATGRTGSGDARGGGPRRGTGLDVTRVAVVAGRKVGGAVQRNRAKRRLRAALAGGTLPAGLDVVVVARGGVLTADFTSLQAELAGLVKRAASRIPTP